MGGTAAKRASGRGSQMGARVLKDTRPLTEKSFQVEQIKKILDFLRQNKYHNSSLTSKHFPLNTKEFVSIFNFLYSFLDSRFTNKLPAVKFEEDALRTLKSLNYPGNMTICAMCSLQYFNHSSKVMTPVDFKSMESNIFCLAASFSSPVLYKSESAGAYP